MEVTTVKRADASMVALHTITAAMSTLDMSGIPESVTRSLHEDLQALVGLESSLLVEAAQDMVKIAIRHSIKPTTETHAEARIARDKLGDLLIHVKQV